MATVRANDALGFRFVLVVVVVDKRFGLVSDESFRDFMFDVDDDDDVFV